MFAIEISPFQFKSQLLVPLHFHNKVHQKHTWYFWLGHALLGLLWWQLHQQQQHGRLEVQGASELMNGKCSKTHKNLRFHLGNFRAKIWESMITRHLGFEGFHCTNIPTALLKGIVWNPPHQSNIPYDLHIFGMVKAPEEFLFQLPNLNFDSDLCCSTLNRQFQQSNSPTVRTEKLVASSLHLWCCFSGFGKGMTGMMKLLKVESRRSPGRRWDAFLHLSRERGVRKWEKTLDVAAEFGLDLRG